VFVSKMNLISLQSL